MERRFLGWLKGGVAVKIQGQGKSSPRRVKATGSLSTLLSYQQ